MRMLVLRANPARRDWHYDDDGVYTLQECTVFRKGTLRAANNTLNLIETKCRDACSAGSSDERNLTTRSRQCRSKSVHEDTLPSGKPRSTADDCRCIANTEFRQKRSCHNWSTLLSLVDYGFNGCIVAQRLAKNMNNLLRRWMTV